MLTLGIEEEVFVTEPERPTVKSLYFLAKLLAKDPGFYYVHSASNFARGSDLKQGLMSGVELSTGIHTDADSLIEDLHKRRADLASVTTGLIVPMGHLLNYDAPTNTCSIQIHLGGDYDRRLAYNNIIHFLPILPLFTINSPMVLEEYYGQSYRMKCSFAVGPIQDDWTIRFQDVILSKRLGTIEFRVCDPCWDLDRVKWLVKVLCAIVQLTEKLPSNDERYNSQRENISQHGLLDENTGLVDELQQIINFPEALIVNTASDQVREAYRDWGLVGAYSALDNGYRNRIFKPQKVTLKQKKNIPAGIVGFVGYYLARFPYYAWKGLVE